MAQDEIKPEAARQSREAAAERAAIAVRPEFRSGAEAGFKDKVFEMRGIEVLYSGVSAVKGISMDVGHNEVTALIGPSG